MKIVGLKIDAGRVSVAVVEKGLRRTELIDSFSVPFASDDELAALLRERSRGWAGGRIVSSISGRRFGQHTVTLPFSDRKRVDKALPFELEDAVPFDLDEALIDYYAPSGAAPNKSGQETAVCGLIVPGSVVRRHLEQLAAGNVDPQAIVPSFLGLFNIARNIPIEGTAVLIQGEDLCLKDGGAVKACRSFSRSRAAGGLRHSLKALEVEFALRIEKAVLLADDPIIRTELTELQIPAEVVAPDFNGKTAADPVSLGLALSEDVNFRKGEFLFRREDAGIRKRRRTLIIAGTVAALLAVGNLGVKYYMVESAYARLDNEIKDLFRKTLPESRAAGDPVRTLRTKLEDAKKTFGVLGSGSSALDAMKAVTDGIPKEVRVSFQEFLLEGDRLRLQAEAASFESVDKIKTELMKSGQFSDIQIADSRMGVDNKVKFRMEIKLKQAM